MKLPKKCVVDTNIPIVANLLKHPDRDSDIDNVSILECIKAIKHVQSNNTLVLDNKDIIYNQYHDNLSKTAKHYGDLGTGDVFYLWVRDNRYGFPQEDRVEITIQDDSYQEFPVTEDLNDFDPSDKIFVAVANKHSEKPPILQATDSKWWGYKDKFEAIGIKIIFLCPEYVEKKYREKME